jgi:Na+/proline symporter
VGGLFWKKANTYGAFSSFIGGLVSWIIGYILIYPSIAEKNMINGFFFNSWAMWDTIYVAAVPAFIISIMAFIVGSLVTQKIDPPKPLLDANGNIMEDQGFFFWSKTKYHSVK